MEDVVLREGKKRKGSALVVMRDAAGAAGAADAVNGALVNPLLVVPFAKAAGADALGAAEDEAPAAAATGPLNGRGGSEAAGAAPRAFAAGPAGAGSGSGLGSRPAAPLFAAGASSLFPGAGSSGGGAGGAPPLGKPLFAAGAAFAAGGHVAQPPAAGGQQQHSAGAGGFSSFSSFRGAAPGSASAGVAALGAGGLEDATLARMRQAAERRRLVEEMERAEAGAEAGG